MRLNGVSVGSTYKHVASYCMQDDALHSALTVRENILFSALLHLPATTPRKEVDIRVNAIIEEFGLARVQKKFIGNAIIRGVSGGERRRVSIACEIVADPAIIFLDEPTSGLDSAAAYQVCMILQTLARHYNKTVVATIHQPSTETFAQFDKLLLLVGGKIVYFGGRDAATEYFAQVGNPVPQFCNPADHYLALVNMDFAVDKEEGKRTVERVRGGRDIFWVSKKNFFFNNSDFQLVTAYAQNPVSNPCIEGTPETGANSIAQPVFQNQKVPI